MDKSVTLNTNLTNKIFVTGGTGFLGSYVIRYLLQKGYTKIIALKRKTSAMQMVEDVQDQVEWVDGDVLDIIALEDAMQGIDIVFHCAAMISFAPNERKLMMAVNREGTANLVNIALYAGVKKFIHVSSIESLGLKNGAVFNEKTPLEKDRLNTHYGLTKHLGEQEVWRGMAEGLNAIIINPGVILGVGDWNHGPLQFFKLAAKGYPLCPIGASGMVDVKDVARFSVEISESDISKERFIVIAENWSYLDLMNRIADQFGNKRPSIKLGAFLNRLFWSLEGLRAVVTGTPPLITKESALIASVRHQYDNSKSINALNFSYTPIEETIKEAVKAYNS